MKKSDRLQVIVDLNANNEKKALEALGKAQREQQASRVQLENLQSYHQEYKKKYQSISGAGINITQLLEFRSFVSKLDKAIGEQEQVVIQGEKDVVYAREYWERQHQKTKSLEKVCQSALAEEFKQEERREQNEQDDRACRLGGASGTRNA